VGGQLFAPATLSTAFIEYDAGQTPDMFCTLWGRDKSLASASCLPKTLSPLRSHTIPTTLAGWLPLVLFLDAIFTIFLLFTLAFPANTTLKMTRTI